MRYGIVLFFPFKWEFTYPKYICIKLRSLPLIIGEISRLAAKHKGVDVNFCKDHRNKIEVLDPLAVEDLISSKLNNKRKFARLITQYRDIFFPNISEGTAFLLQGVTE